MKNSVLTLYLLYVYLSLNILTCTTKFLFKVFGVFFWLIMEKYQRWALKSSSFIYFASASPQPLNRILHLNEK